MPFSISLPDTRRLGGLTPRRANGRSPLQKSMARMHEKWYYFVGNGCVAFLKVHFPLILCTQLQMTSDSQKADGRLLN